MCFFTVFFSHRFHRVSRVLQERIVEDNNSRIPVYLREEHVAVAAAAAAAAASDDDVD